MTNTIDQELKDRYEAVHAAIMNGPDYAIQGLIDQGTIWSLEGAMGRAAMDALRRGACVCPPEPGEDFYGNPIPPYWMLKDEAGSTGSVANAEAFDGDEEEM